MDIYIQVFTLLIGGIITGIVGFLVNKFSSKQKLAEEKKRRIAQTEVATAQIELVRGSIPEIASGATQKYLKYLVESLKSVDSLTQTPAGADSPLNISDIEKHVEKSVLPLKKRLEEIERRFPQESTIEKIASVNEAVLASKFDSLTASIKRIEDKTLTKWDVTVVVLEIIGAFVTLGGVVVGIFSYFAARGTP